MAPLVLLFLGCSARASDILLITRTGDNTEIADSLEQSAHWSGLDLNHVVMSSVESGAAVLRASADHDLMAMVISSDALPYLDHSAVLSALHREHNATLPLLIVAVGTDEGSGDLAGWSGGGVLSCTPATEPFKTESLVFTKAFVLNQLAGLTVPSTVMPACRLTLSSGRFVTPLIEVQRGGQTLPLLVRVSVDGHSVWVAAQPRYPVSFKVPAATPLQTIFSRVAVWMVFLREAAGDRAWHLPAAYANFTIDDPWLTEPYGGVKYGSLLEEMEKHRFHTTIAFIPWNFDRSEPEVVNIFKEHPDFFSICIHGNNHNHREFDSLSQQPTVRQEQNIRQALVRMDRFQQLTHLSYDPVMVFPHAIAPAETFELLKTNGYWATFNSEDVPLGSSVPDEPLFGLRPWSLGFHGFPAIKRTSVEAPVSSTDIAINAFLGNPQLFYAHQEYFADGISAFDATADRVNLLQPQIQWKSLGYIARHFYLLRLRPDHDFDVIAMAPNLELSNPTNHFAVFHVKIPANLEQSAHTLLIDDASDSAWKTGDPTRLDVALDPGQTRSIQLIYTDSHELDQIGTLRSSPAIYLDRKLSDIRDLYLSRTIVGRSIQSLYYGRRLNTFQSVIMRSLGIILAAITACLLWYLVMARWKRRNSATHPESQPEVITKTIGVQDAK
jgi:hypothetical protein